MNVDVTTLVRAVHYNLLIYSYVYLMKVKEIISDNKVG